MAFETLAGNLGDVGVATALLPPVLLFVVIYGLLTYRDLFRGLMRAGTGKLVVGVLLKAVAAGILAVLAMFVIMMVVPAAMFDTLFGWIPGALAPVIQLVPLLVIIADFVFQYQNR